MNYKLEEHLKSHPNGTLAGKRFLHLDEMKPEYNYAANTYLVALAEIVALRARIETQAETIESLTACARLFDRRVTAFWNPAYEDRHYYLNTDKLKHAQKELQILLAELESQ